VAPTPRRMRTLLDVYGSEEAIAQASATAFDATQTTGNGKVAA